MRNHYQTNGYQHRDDYLATMASEYRIDIDDVIVAARRMTAPSIFHKLPVALQEMRDEADELRWTDHQESIASEGYPRRRSEWDRYEFNEGVL